MMCDTRLQQKRTWTTRWLIGLAIVFFGLASTIATPLASTAAQSTPTSVPSNGCSRNQRPEQACPLAVDAVNGPYPIFAPGIQDFYRLDLGTPNGLQTTIAVRSAEARDLLTSITHDDGTPIGLFSSPAISTTLGADITGPVILQVENGSSGESSGQTYTIEVRRTLPPVPPSARDTNLPPDKLENNWNPITAAPIGVGVIYDLNFVCPVAWGCAGGDHDYLRLPVKRGTRYLICTFDLGPGVDTEIDLFWGTSDTPIAGNDDVRPNTSFLSVIRWVAPADGDVIIRIAPRTGGTNPLVFDEKASTYRFAVALAGSAFTQQLEQRIAEQTDAPKPPSQSSGGMPVHSVPTAATAPATTSPASVPTASEASASNVTAAGTTTRGQAVVIARETAFRIAPNSSASLIQMLPAETLLTLAGQYRGLWVSATTADSVLPGWVLGIDLRRAGPAQATAVVSPTAGVAASSAPITPTVSASTRPTTAADQVISVRPIAPLPLEAAPTSAPQSSVTISVTLVAAPTALSRIGSTARTPTPLPITPLAELRVQLVNAFGDLLAEGITGARGAVTLSHATVAGASLAVRVPAAGLEVPIDPRQPAITIALPPGGQP